MNKQQKQAFEVLSKRIVDEADVARLDAFLQGKDIKEPTSIHCMNEDFVSFELAKKLKKKGFKQKCLAYYDVEDNVGLLYNTQYSDELLPCQYTDLLASYNSGDIADNLDTSDNCIDAPTISQVLKWLREDTRINVNIRLFVENGWYFTIQNHKGEPIHSQLTDTDDLYLSYEQAALAGIEYVLDNLI